MNLKQLSIYQDGANLSQLKAIANNTKISGFTTNPTLMAKENVTNYTEYARQLINASAAKPISFEVFSDNFEEMERQAKIISSWAANVFVKIPITNTKSEPSFELIKTLSDAGIKVNITAVFTDEQFEETLSCLDRNVESIISVFAGRIADTGIDPVPIMKRYASMLKGIESIKLLWASPREILNLYQAVECGCDIITMTPDLIAKVSLSGKDLAEYSRDTVQMFFDDAQNAGFSL